MRLLLDKIDAVHYTEQSRLLKIAERYAYLLLRPKYGEDEARAIADRLVNRYPSHDVVIG